MKLEKNIIEINNLNFSYGERKILDKISLSIEKNKLIGILGPNGCGKSTLLKNILGYLNSSSGNIKIYNRDLKSYSQKEKSKLISLVPQKSQLVSAISVEEFVLMGRLPHLKNSWAGYSKEDRDTTKASLKSLELEKFSTRIVPTLSGGEFQRVLLARAITQNTDIILLDEPTSALDLNHAIELMEKVKNIILSQQKTAIMVLHDLNLASLFCDELIMLKSGKVFCKGTPKQVLTKDNLKAVYNLDCNIIYDKNNLPYIIPKIKKIKKGTI